MHVITNESLNQQLATSAYFCLRFNNCHGPTDGEVTRAKEEHGKREEEREGCSSCCQSPLFGTI